MHFIARFSTPHIHSIALAIEADTPEAAQRAADHAFSTGEFDSGDGRIQLQHDDFDEDGDAGWGGLDGIEAVPILPAPDASVASLRADDAARRCAQALVQAYAYGADNGGSVDWSDVDVAHELALRALGLTSADTAEGSALPTAA